MVIDMPKKIWRPKVKSRYKPPLYNKDVDEGMFLFDSLGAAVFRPDPWESGMQTDFVMFDEDLHGKKFNSANINLDGVGVLLPTLKQIVQSYWDYFAIEGICRVIVGYEFAIGTGDAPPVCCKKPYYGPNTTKCISMNI